MWTPDSSNIRMTMSPQGRAIFVFALMVSLGCVARPARAELVFFNTGRSLSIKSHRVDGDSLVLVLRGGGEIVCDRAIVSRVTPDEVPYPEPEAAAPAPLPAAVAGPFSEIIDRVAAEQDVPVKLVRAVIQVESAYNVRARSPKGAMGLMQLMPTTALELGVHNAFDPAENIRGGTAYLRQLLDRYDGDEQLALAAYNAGAGAVDRHGRRVPPFQETRDYVRRVGSFASVEGPVTVANRQAPKRVRVPACW